MESTWSSSPAALEKMMGKHAPRSAAAYPGLASASTKRETGPRTIPSTILHRAARCSFSPRRKTSRLPTIPGHYPVRVSHDNRREGLLKQLRSELPRVGAGFQAGPGSANAPCDQSTGGEFGG